MTALNREAAGAAWLVVLALLALAPGASAVPPPIGGLTQLPGIAACIAEDDLGGACFDGNGLAGDGYHTIALSPDGKNAYVAADDSSAVAILSRNPATGVLTQPAGSAGCIAEDPLTTPGCADGRGLESANGVAVSPDGKHVYVASKASDAVAIFSRDLSSGALTQLPGQAGCTSEDGFDHPGGTAASCTDGKGLDGARSVQVSADGAHVYVGSQTSNAVAAFIRGSDGGLTQLAGEAGCTSQDGFDHPGGTAASCTDGKALVGPRSLTLSPDGRNAYVAATISNAVAIFSRGPSGALTQLPETEGCVSEDGSTGACVDGEGLEGVASVAFSPNGANAYVASITSAAVAVFSRASATGALTQLAGSAGCIADLPAPPGCGGGKALGNANWAAVSPDGVSVYVASIDPTDAIAVFARDPVTGAIAQLPGTAGCVSDTGSGGQCADGTALAGASSLVVSPDNLNAYTTATGSDAVAAFSRQLAPVCMDVSRTLPYGRTTTVPLTCSDPNGDPITRSIATGPAHGSLALIDQFAGSVAFTPSRGFAGIDSFTFTASDGSATSSPATASLTVAKPPAFGARTRVRLRLLHRRIAARGPLKVVVSNANAFRVSGRLSGRTTRRVSLTDRGRKRRIRLKAKRVSVGAHASRTVALKLPRTLRRLLRRDGKLSLRLTAKVRDPAGNTRRVTRRVSPRLKN